MTLTKTSDEQQAKHDGRFRRFFAQFLAVTVKNILLFDLGLYFSFPGIVIPALTGILNEQNVNETLSITAEQASWIGSIGFIVEPLGCVLSAMMTDPLGRKYTMFVVNIPLIIGWFMLYNATSVWEIYIAIILLGLGSGLMESPIITYVGEICEPSVRGVMISYSIMTGTFGMFFVFILNTLLPWREAALFCLSVPILTVIALCFVPETPLWLLSKNKTAKAEKSLRWLRGWVSKEAVAQEFQALQRYSKCSKSCATCIKQNQKCAHPLPTMGDKFHELKRKQTLKPLFIVMTLFLISQFSGIFAMSPFIVQILKAYETPISPDRTAALLGFMNMVGSVVFLGLLRFTGKRRLYLVSLTVVLLCAVTISIYGFVVLPNGYNSFDQTQGFSLENKQLGYIPFISIILWTTFTFCGVNGLPWQMLSEIFPFKTRGIASGLSAALNYVISFVATKTYYNLETSLSLPGAALFNCIVVTLGLILMYKILPETENRTLEDIELHFSDNSKKMTNCKIPKSKDQPNKLEAVCDLNEISNKKTLFSEIDQTNNPRKSNGCGFIDLPST